MKKVTLFILFILFFRISFCQDNNENTIKIGVLAVNSSYDEIYSNILQANITKILSSKKRFTVVDRTKLDAIAKEKNLQKKEDFINSSFLAEQGRSIGAEYLVSTNINSIIYTPVNIEKTNILTNQKTIVLGLKVEIVMDMNIIDVSTGTVKSGKTFQNNYQYESHNVNESITKSLNNFIPEMVAWVNNVFSVEMKIIRIETKDKHGMAETVLIKGGSDMNLSKSKQFGLLNNSSELAVYYNDSIKVDGSNLNRKVEIGRIKISENQGDFSIAKIKKGAKDIQTKLEEGKTLYLSILKY